MSQAVMSVYCPRHKHLPPITDKVNGEIICSKCAIVLEEKTIHEGYGGLNSDDYESSNNSPIARDSIFDGVRTRMSSTINGSSMRTMNSAYGRILFADRRAVKQEIKSANSGAAKVLDLGNHLNLPPVVIGDAVQLYRKSYNNGTLRNKSALVSAAAIVFGVCRSSGIYRTMNEIAKFVGKKPKLITKQYYEMASMFKVTQPENAFPQIVNLICTRLDIKTKLARRVLDLIESKGEIQFAGSSKHGIVAGAISYILEQNYMYIPKTRISEHSGVTTVTICKYYHFFKNDV